MMQIWPDLMPQPVYEEIAIGAPTGAVIRTSMDAGPAKQRRRFTAAPRPLSLVFEPVSAVGIAAFEAFYLHDLAHGSLDFQMQHPVTDIVGRFRFIATDEPWNMQPVGIDAYRLNVSLEQLP